MRIKKIMNAVSKAITFITIVIILAAGCVVLPNLVGIKPYIVLSGSMEPVIHTGAVAYVNTHINAFHPGDIVTYQMGEDLVTHRIIRMEDGQYVTKGDANETEDLTLVSAEQMVGRYLFQIPYLGYLAADLSPGILIMIAAWIFLLNGISLALTYVVEKTVEEKDDTHSTIP